MEKVTSEHRLEGGWGLSPEVMRRVLPCGGSSCGRRYVACWRPARTLTQMGEGMREKWVQR
jgi:hypothetical protein